jgi:uncharacterized protein
MSSGLLALLDDVAAIAKVAAASIDDVTGMAAKAGAKSAGVVIDDAAVTPRYVVGFTADRELPIIRQIAVGSLKNKLLFLLPAALGLSLAAPWAIVPLLMLGGLYLCFEGAEKVAGLAGLHAGHAEADTKGPAAGTPEGLERRRVASAIRTDFILSAEIMALTLASIPAEVGLSQKAAVLAIVGVGITMAVYGAVALIVKADDFGVRLATSKVAPPPVPALGRAIVAAMPGFLRALTVVGTLAMLWVGGGILIHGLAVLGWAAPEHLVHELAGRTGAALPGWPGATLGWLAGAVANFTAGLVVGAALIPVVERAVAPLAARFGRRPSDG